jgi:hypothetical protein
MSTNELIRQLAHGLTPVKPSTARRRFWLLAVLTIVFVAVLLGCVHLRPDLRANLWSWVMLTQAAIAGCTCVALISLARVLQPERHLTSAERTGFSIFPLALFAELVIRYVFQVTTWASAQLSAVHCAKVVTMTGIGVGVGLVAYARRYATCTPTATTTLIASAATAIGAFVVGFSCGNDNPMHLLGAHLAVPLVIVWLTSFLLSRQFLRF